MIKSMVIDLEARELIRRKALSALDDQTIHEQATQDLLHVWRSDRDYPLGPAAGLTADEIRALVPIFVVEGTGALVRASDITEPWATRFQVASYGSICTQGGYLAQDWEHFLDLWHRKAQQIEDLVEQELERLVSAGIQKAQARSATTLTKLGIDSAELGEWVAEQVEKGRWPDGDLLDAFLAWRDKKNSSKTAQRSIHT